MLSSILQSQRIFARRRMATSVLTGLILFGVSASAQTAPLGAYGFNENTGTTTGDSSGNGLTGTLQGATWNGSGRYGKAISFDGASSFVDLGNAASFQMTGSMTVSAWVCPTAHPADDGQILAKSDDSIGWQLKTTPDTGVRTFGIAISNGSARTQRYSKTVYTLNTWYHVAGVYNAAAQTLDIYVNGVLDNGVLSGTIPSAQTNAGVNINVGTRTGGYWFIGTIDEARLYGRALTAAQIQTDMNTPIGNVAPPPATACDLNSDQTVNSADVQLAVDMTLGRVAPCTANILGAGVCNVAVVQRVTNAVTGGSCAVGTSPVPHSVTLSWVASTSANVAGYNVYRGTSSGGPYTLQTSAPISGTSYTDSSVQGGQTVYYVVTSVDNSNNASTYSNEAVAALPAP
jgi:hypothetical protein